MANFGLSILDNVDNVVKDSSIEDKKAIFIIDKIIKLNSEIDELVEQKNALELKLKELMKTNEILTCNNEIVATWKVAQKECFKSADFKKDYPDIYEDYTTTAKYRTFRLKKLTESQIKLLKNSMKTKE